MLAAEREGREHAPRGRSHLTVCGGGRANQASRAVDCRMWDMGRAAEDRAEKDGGWPSAGHQLAMLAGHAR